MHLSTRSQTARLQKLLEKYHILSNGVITKSSGSVSVDDRNQINAILDYFVETGKVGSIQQWFPPEVGEQKSSVSAQDLAEDLGIEYVAKYQRNIR